MHFPVNNHQVTSSWIRYADADAGIFHCRSNSDIIIWIRFILIEVWFDRFQRLRKSCFLIRDLSIRKRLSGTNRISVTNFPARNTDHLCKLVDQRFDRRARLRHSEASESSRRWVIRIVCIANNAHIVIVIGTTEVGAGSLQYRTTKRSISAGIGNDMCLNPLNNTVFITTDFAMNGHGMPFGMVIDTLLARKGDFYRSFQQESA